VSGDLPGTEEHAAPELIEAHALAGGIDPADVWNALERIRNSPAMSGCNRLMQLLSFVVGATVRGEAGHLKETTIGVSVFGRSPDYDPKADTIVRSQAWRLRAKLRQYYASSGATDPIIIDVPTGHYVPVFRRRDGEESQGVASGGNGSGGNGTGDKPTSQLDGAK